MGGITPRHQVLVNAIGYSSAMLLDPAEGQRAIPLWLVGESALPQWLSKLDPASAAWLNRHGFQAERARVMTVPEPIDLVAPAVAGLGALGDTAPPSLWGGAACAERRPAGLYTLAT